MSRFSCFIPIPLSTTEKVVYSSPCDSLTTTYPPSSVNLRAFCTRLIKTCFSLFLSPCISAISLSFVLNSVKSVIFFSLALTPSWFTTSFASLTTFTVSIWSLILSDARREKSRSSSTKVISLSVSSCIIPSPKSSSSLLIPSYPRVSLHPFIDVSGVLSSWDTEDINSSFNLRVLSISFAIWSNVLTKSPISSSWSFSFSNFIL